MDKVLQMFFEMLLYKNDNVEKIETVEDLYATVGTDSMLEILRMFAYLNDDQDGFSTEEILASADRAYQTL